jgi:hypothetical protein
VTNRFVIQITFGPETVELIAFSLKAELLIRCQQAPADVSGALQHRAPLCEVGCRMQSRQCDVSRRRSQIDINNYIKFPLFLYFSYETINSGMLSEFENDTAEYIKGHAAGGEVG